MQHSLILLLVFIFLASASKDPICTHGYKLVKNRCLKLFSEPSNYENAQRQCYQHGGPLVTIRSKEENLDVLALAGKGHNLWIGLYCFTVLDQNGSLSNCIWDDSLGTAEQYHAFESFAGSGSRETPCVTVNTTTGYWISTKYENGMYPFVCEMPTTIEDDCQNNYNGYCYIPHSEAKSFENAQKSCEEECGNLVSIHSANENLYLNILAYNFLPGEYIYIGGMVQDFGFSRWTDGSRWSYEKFDRILKRKNGECVVVAGDWEDVIPIDQWVTTPCNRIRQYFCKRPAGEKCLGGRPKEIGPLVSYTCNSTLLQTPGIIVSPQSQERQYCEYQMHTPGFYSILLTFTTFDLDPKSDELKVYDGDSEQNRLIGTFKGNNEISVTSSGSAMFVTYRSNGTGSGKGFEAKFQNYHYPNPLKKSNQ
ncbi:C-type LECtin [Caenorhabditis elegans]|uniref:C-type LECtin n=1 Tax=Caenorhabditis elegans TaxID=6239 RepID=O76608_CAEEL|nr:C-type LECtin [Caenorhabditis elegans]CCD63699.1 C-type LECtin [Caenorhabditis elegans]|eukprot:NP_494002.2 C-type LECtin [Caenorhabditis elegans]